MRYSLIVAADLDDCIGHKGGLPWHIPADLARFRSLTNGHVCISGSRTHDSIVERINKPLPGRISVVVSRSRHASHDSVIYVEDPKSALSVATSIETFANGVNESCEVFVIGGADIFRELIDSVDTIYLTRVSIRAHGDTFMPNDWLNGFVLKTESTPIEHSTNQPAYVFQAYERYLL